MADGSAWYQERSFHVVGFERREDFGNGLIDQRGHIRLQTHEHQRLIGERTDDTFIDKFV